MPGKNPPSPVKETTDTGAKTGAEPSTFPHNLLLISGLIGFSGVALGAFGAHALKATLTETGYMETWKTAVFYQMLHAVGLLFLAIWAHISPGGRLLRAAAWLWVAGVLLFSGSLYAISLGGPRWLGPVTPLGGLCFLAGWLLLAIMGLKKSR